MKAAPNGLEPTSDAARAALASLVTDSFDWFKGLVKSRRDMTDAELAAVDDGRVFTGRQGLPLKLIDELGTEETAVKWLESDRNVAHGLPIRTYERQARKGVFGLFAEAAGVADAFGFSEAGRLLSAVSPLADRPRLDGLLAVWQGGLDR